MTLKVLLVTHFYPSHGGGIERVAEQLARRLTSAHDTTITWCASNTDSPPDDASFRFEPMSALNIVERVTGFPYPLWAPSSLFRLARLVREVDAVHVHDGIYVGSLVAAAIARRYRKRLVVTQHIGAVPLRAPLRWLLALANQVAARLVLGSADAVGFISPAVRRYFAELAGDRRSFHYVANGVDLDVFSPVSEAPSELRRRLGFDGDRPLLLFVGRFVPKKRLPVLRDMAAARPDWQWCVIGDGPEQPVAWELPNVSVRKSMLQKELADYYRAADLLVLPSEGEGFPLVVQEAMACGLPSCITPDVAAGSTVPKELMIRLQGSRTETARMGAAAIEEWLRLPPSSRHALRNACASFAARSWSWDAAAQTHGDWLRGSSA
jgi:glycosyltransferase involved in cell wall biosynthesis